MGGARGCIMTLDPSYKEFSTNLEENTAFKDLRVPSQISETFFFVQSSLGRFPQNHTSFFFLGLNFKSSVEIPLPSTSGT